MLKISVQVNGIPETIASLQRVKQVLSTFEPELTSIGEYLMTFFSENVFASEGQIYGERWFDLSMEYEMWKVKHYPGRGILQASGTLQGGYRAMTTENYLLIGNQTDYAIFHQLGTSKMPQRILLQIDQERQNAIIDMLREGVIERIKNVL